ncbi:nitrate reductase molybdenum cofactor assembly chaperone [Hoeflea prorocentri]|uniref:Nitrate reductase molybdenum cofactor assembly chaperone n=1 Tax=Hoeflea prorocentri TaxID=1922333 RepID=A0A9X3ZGT9_9HYPH|nr:nitrate reductase molybdenum cofactor assembly chaperone [Hoeflea prorocentri]MCY6380161.1 nitrate reductase molybdenum cofactor assembly chaperone [Hoeflea prorocentri]MDA5397961.1 nitrate reductase molybdenum cofactor assembly chaperone [Hoeflea prorocentri]
MNRTLKIVSLLLSYPTKELQDGIPELNAALADDVGVDKRAVLLLTRLADDIAALDLYDAQERYVHLFDRTRTLSLHLFEHVHGESRDRGGAMVDLMEMYRNGGFDINARELPDHLPMFLEFLSVRPEPDARESLGQTAHILAALRERLKKRKSIYANAFAALEIIAREKPDEALLEGLLQEPLDDPDDLEALDRIWEEEVVTFGGNAGENACGPDRLQRQMRAHQRKPDSGAAAPHA